MLHVVTNCEDGFPARDRVGADHGVNGGKFFAGIVRGATGGSVEFEIIVLGGFVELGLCVGGGQGVKELLVGSGNAVV